MRPGQSWKDKLVPRVNAGTPSADLNQEHYCHPGGYLQICCVLGGETGFFNIYFKFFLLDLIFLSGFWFIAKLGGR